jgi:hypothetical protein
MAEARSRVAAGGPSAAGARRTGTAVGGTLAAYAAVIAAVMASRDVRA